MQLTENISEDDEQHLLGAILQGSLGKLHRWLCYTGKDNNRTWVLQTQVLRVGQVNEPCIGLIQENSIENSI